MATREANKQSMTILAIGYASLGISFLLSGLLGIFGLIAGVWVYKNSKSSLEKNYKAAALVLIILSAVLMLLVFRPSD
jgi:glucose uptake protein GlcU